MLYVTPTSADFLTKSNIVKVIAPNKYSFFRNARHMYIALPSSNSHYTQVALVVTDRGVADVVVAAAPVAANTDQRGSVVRRRRRSMGPFGRERQCGRRHHDPVAVTIGHDGYLRGPVLSGPNWETKS